MAVDFIDLTISGGNITVPTDTYLVPSIKGSVLTVSELEATLRAVQVRNINVLPESGNADQLDQILGGLPGSQVILRPKNVGDLIQINSSSNLHIPTGTIILSDPKHTVMFVCVASNQYVKLI